MQILSHTLPYKIDDLVDVLTKGEPVLIFDSDKREGETDIFFLGKTVKDSSVRLLRKEGGGMVFLASEFNISKKLGLPFMSDVYAAASAKPNNFPYLNRLANNSLPYDKRSSFSLFINHKDTFTGITDKDRSLTARQFSELCEKSSTLSDDACKEELVINFRSPGHLPVCIADSNLLQGRQGHTELAVSLLKFLGLPPVALGCEMLSETGNALPSDQARKWAKNKGYLFLEGRDIVEACQ
ncbi:MAG: 3,4-dihydroxy-2-butanone-4-phosphate synthase [Candidatus Poseidoniales archaeon]